MKSTARVAFGDAAGPFFCLSHQRGKNEILRLNNAENNTQQPILQEVSCILDSKSSTKTI